MELHYVFAIFACVIGVIVYDGWSRKRKERRRKSLRQDSNGTWHWTGFDGSPHSSRKKPDEPGGEWSSEGALFVGNGGGGYDGGTGGFDGGAGDGD